tara:strand:- start:46 stop:219 length:174 start_codon:yes stop_codon:yes gene_type:complete
MYATPKEIALIIEQECHGFAFEHLAADGHETEPSETDATFVLLLGEGGNFKITVEAI